MDCSLPGSCVHEISQARILAWVVIFFSRVLRDPGMEPMSPPLQVDSLPKHLPGMLETWVQFLGWEDPLEKEIATHASTLAWKIPWMEEPGRL